jgi:hypothetical protein
MVPWSQNVLTQKAAFTGDCEQLGQLFYNLAPDLPSSGRMLRRDFLELFYVDGNDDTAFETYCCPTCKRYSHDRAALTLGVGHYVAFFDFHDGKISLS